MSAPRRKDLVLGLYPFTRGVAFAALHSPLSPVDWGLKIARNGDKDRLSFEVARSLIDRLQPKVLVLGDCTTRKSRPPSDIGKLHRHIGAYAASQGIKVQTFSKPDIRRCFAAVGATTRYEIARAIAAKVDALGDRLPPQPTTWDSQNQRLGLFDAAALAMTYYCQKKAPRRSPPR